MGLFGRRKQEPDRDQPVGSTPAASPAAAVVNDRVRAALGTWADRKDVQGFADVLRRAVTGELLLDITDSEIADPAAYPQVGDTLAITSQVDDAGRRLLVAFTSNDELARYRGRPGRSLVQPAAAVLAQAARGYEGVVIDGRSPGMFIAYREEIERQLDGDPEAAGRRAEAVLAAAPLEDLLAVLDAGPVYVPFEERRDASGAPAGVILPRAKGPDGASWAIAGTSPAQLWAWDPAVGAQRTGFANIARAALEDGQAGVVVDPAGPPFPIPATVLERYAG